VIGTLENQTGKPGATMKVVIEVEVRKIKILAKRGDFEKCVIMIYFCFEGSE